MIDLRAAVERYYTGGLVRCDQCAEYEQPRHIQRWRDGDGISRLCRECLSAARHEHDAAIADRAADMLEHGPALHRDDLHAIARAAFPRVTPTVRIPVLVGRLGPARVPTLRTANH